MNNLRSFLLIFLAIPLAELYAEEEPIDLIYQKINSLQQEIEALRNLIEENAYLLERLQELQQQRYIDLDKRLHDILSRELVDLDKSISIEELIQVPNDPLSLEISLYQKALELFDSERYSEALNAFREQIISFPEGQYSADAYFWSGELFLAQKQMEDARENYFVVTEKYPDHSRTPDAIYKLGLISRNLDQERDAVVYFSRVLEEFPDSGAALLAKKSLEIPLQESTKID